MASIEGVLDPGDFAVALGPIDSADTDDIVEEMDAVESLRCRAPDGPRGGRAGDG